MTSDKNAGRIGRGIYVTLINQLHLSAWCARSLEALEGARIAQKIMEVKYGTDSSEYTSTMNTLRDRLYELGYVPLEVSKSN